MRYRKFAADNIFTGYTFLDDRYALITDMEGRVIEIISRADAGDDLEIFEGILCPGLVNCHCHLELSHMKGLIPENSGMVPFLLSVMRNRTASKEVIGAAIKTAEAGMYHSGIAAVADICNTTDTLTIKQTPRLYFQNFIEATGFVGQTAPQKFSDSQILYQAFKNQPASIVPHAPYSVSAELFELIANMDANHLLSMHNQEAVSENQFFESGEGPLKDLYSALGINISAFTPTGVSSLQSCLGLFHSSQTMLLVHNTVTSAKDLDWIEEQNELNNMPQCFWCLCPKANLYINNQLPDIDLFRQRHCRIIVGTDSLASNDTLDILEELKAIHQRFPTIPLDEMLKWATVNGAEALGIRQEFGSFESGKKPGIALICNAGTGLGPASFSLRLL